MATALRTARIEQTNLPLSLISAIVIIIIVVSEKMSKWSSITNPAIAIAMPAIPRIMALRLFPSCSAFVAAQ